MGVSSSRLWSSQKFNPEQYNALADLMAKQYAATGQPTRLLEMYLSVFTTQRVKAGEVGAQGAGALVLRAAAAPHHSPLFCVQETWAEGDYDDRMALIANSALPVIVRAFGEQTVLIWNAMLLRKRCVDARGRPLSRLTPGPFVCAHPSAQGCRLRRVGSRHIACGAHTATVCMATTGAWHVGVGCCSCPRIQRRRLTNCCGACSARTRVAYTPRTNRCCALSSPAQTPRCRT